MAQRRQNPLIQEWISNPIKATFASLFAISTILASGFAIGVSKRDMDFEIEKIKLSQQCNEAVQKAVNDCREEKLAKQERAIQDIIQVIETIEKKK